MRERTGRLLEKMGILSREEVIEILDHSRHHNMSFGEAAIRLGRLKNQSPLKLRHQMLTADFFHLSADHFPHNTKDFLSREQILKFGVLPLGLKKKGLFKKTHHLNLGYIDPTQSQSIHSLETVLLQLRPDQFSSIHRYLILMEEFVAILDRVYGVSEDTLLAMPPGALEPSLAVFIREPTSILKIAPSTSRS